MSIIPNQLNITIRTSIPGYQKVNYNPSMTIPEISKDDQVVRFNPLIKLDKNIIDSVPESIRIKEFFNKGLFDSLISNTIYKTNKRPVKTLTLATRYGNVDNNIKLTLQSIFPSGSIITIGKNKYVIADVQWTSGDWKIDLKHRKEEINLNKITNPYLYSTLVNESIISGQQQLNSLPGNLLYGSSFTGTPSATGMGPPLDEPSFVARGTPGPSAPSETPAPPAPPAPSPPPYVIIVPPGIVPPGIVPPGIVPPGITGGPPLAITGGPSDPLVIRGPQLAITGGPDEDEDEDEDEPLVIASGPSAMRRPPLAITGGPSEPSISRPPLAIPEILPPEDVGESANTNFVKNYFKNITTYIRQGVRIKKNKRIRERGYNFYTLVNTLFINIDNPLIKNVINQIMSNQTLYDLRENNRTIRPEAYESLTESLHIRNNPGGGDCFFYAIADAINFNNYYNRNRPNRLIHMNNIYRFNENIIRHLVFQYWNDNHQHNLLNPRNLFEQAQDTFLPMLNDEFENIINNWDPTIPITNELYITTARDVYHGMDANFLIVIPTEMPPEASANYRRPFRVIDIGNTDQFQRYIYSPEYWGGLEAQIAIVDTLQLYPIVINRVDNILRILNEGLITDRDHIWNKYCFLYYADNHYELITFQYRKWEVVSDRPEITPDHVSIFSTQILNRRSRTIKLNIPYPPIYIVFLLYASTYRLIDAANKEIFPILIQVMNSMETSFQRIRGFPPDSDNYRNFTDPFIWNYSHYFPQRVRQVGGVANRYLQDPSRRRYNQPNFINKGQEYDPTKIAYSIIIDMELYPGTSIPETELKTLKCNSRWNAVRKAWADFTGKPYIIPPAYSMIKSNNKTQINRKGVELKNKNNRTMKRY